MKNLKVIFMGTPDFSVPVLKALKENTNVVLVVTQPDKKKGRKQVLTKCPVKEFALKEGIPVISPEKIKLSYQEILNIPADIIITCAYGQIIPEEILNFPRLGCINVHASLLPKYRGGAPIHWCLINGEEKSGITIMYMDKFMDSGDIISQKEYMIKQDDTTEDLHNKLSILGANLLIDTLPSIINKTNKRVKQNEDEVSFAYNIKRSDEELTFNAQGEDIINKIRGLYSWPLANFKIKNQEIKVLKAHFEPKKVEKTGTILIDKNSFAITCRDGLIYLDYIKPFGKKEMAIKDFINGIKKEEYIKEEVK